MINKTKDKIKIARVSDMECNGVYFTEYQINEMQRIRDEIIVCAYSGLPSVLSYSNDINIVLETI